MFCFQFILQIVKLFFKKKIRDGTIVTTQPVHTPNPADDEWICCGAAGSKVISNCDKWADQYKQEHGLEGKLY